VPARGPRVAEGAGGGKDQQRRPQLEPAAEGSLLVIVLDRGGWNGCRSLAAQQRSAGRACDRLAIRTPRPMQTRMRSLRGAE
jgi:hypothetical protein